MHQTKSPRGLCQASRSAPACGSAHPATMPVPQTPEKRPKILKTQSSSAFRAACSKRMEKRYSKEDFLVRTFVLIYNKYVLV